MKEKEKGWREGGNDQGEGERMKEKEKRWKVREMAKGEGERIRGRRKNKGKEKE